MSTALSIHLLVAALAATVLLGFYHGLRGGLERLGGPTLAPPGAV